MIEALIILFLPWAILGWYLLLSDPTEKSPMEKLHKLMKSGRIHKVIRKTWH